MKKDWEIKTLGEICDIQLGKTPYRKNPKFWDKEKKTNNVWLSIADMKHGQFVLDSTEYITDLGAKSIVKIPKGTLMLSFKLTLGRVSFAGCDLYTNEAIASLLNLSKDVSKEYLLYYFSFYDWDGKSEGDIKVKGKTLNKKKLNSLEIIIPPITIQNKIVAKLKFAMDKLNELQEIQLEQSKLFNNLKKSFLQSALNQN